MEGWIKLHRCLLHNPLVMKDADYLAVWCYILLKATHKDYPALFGDKKIILKPGQLITGRIALSKQLHISQSKVYRILKCYESEHQLEIKVNNKGSLITIVNWELYQDNEVVSEQQMNNERTTNEQQVNTKQEYKNNKKNIYVEFEPYFDALYKPYRNKNGSKAKAFKKFVSWVTTGSEFADIHHKYTVDEIFAGVNCYMRVNKDTDKQYWKGFDTLMNQIPDWVERAKENDE